MLYKIIKDVKVFDVNEKHFVYIKKNEDIFSLIINDKTVLEFNFWSLIKGLKTFVVVSDSFNVYIFKDNKLKIKLEGFGLSEKPINDNQIILSKRVSPLARASRS